MTVDFAIRDWHWELTKRCNLKCLHCIIGNRSDYEMDTQKAFAAISQIVKLGGKRLFITGGEPLMRDDIFLIIKRAQKAGLVVSLISNGTKIDRKFLDSVGNCIQSIAISIDGPLSVQDKIRGAGVYDKCITAIHLIKKQGIDLSVYSTINSLNEKGIGDFLKEMIVIGVNSFHFNEINPEGRAQENKFLLLAPKENKNRANFILRQLKEVIEIDKFDVDTSCSIAPETVYMQSDGKIFSCVEIAFKDPSIHIGNILKDSPEDIKRGISSFLASTFFCKKLKCCYTSYSSPGISINLNEIGKCPMIRRIDNESRFT